MLLRRPHNIRVRICTSALCGCSMWPSGELCMSSYEPGDVAILTPENLSGDVSRFIDLIKWGEIADSPLCIHPARPPSLAVIYLGHLPAHERFVTRSLHRRRSAGLSPQPTGPCDSPTAALKASGHPWTPAEVLLRAPVVLCQPRHGSRQAARVQLRRGTASRIICR